MAIKAPHTLVKENKLWSVIFLAIFGTGGTTAVVGIPKVLAHISDRIDIIEENQMRLLYQNEREWLYKKQERDEMRTMVADNEAFRNVYDDSNLMKTVR